ncbi:hypothetical protein [Microcoleus sp. bin38.metabat.b11b12b14.051]|uniref:hypothetical protein n=1 Tax=Microcoleus sp. bin38.metabat.b11b12b14.051 TaxID=2742709 RepID=UPI0025D279D9|nr:hypothetical protein [Microcoleus sp. bin38.metabat.b11b12b14.051]
MFYSIGDRASGFTDTCSRQENRLKHHSAQPAQADESDDVPGFLAHAKLERDFGVQGNVCVKCRSLVYKPSLYASSSGLKTTNTSAITTNKYQENHDVRLAKIE